MPLLGPQELWSRLLRLVRKLLRRHPAVAGPPSLPVPAEPRVYRLRPDPETAANVESLVLVDLGKESRKLLDQIDLQIRTTGRPFKNGGALATASLPIAGAAAVASLNAGNVFVTSAAPNTLMKAASGGVYSAVVSRSSGQIVAQAPFLPIGAGTTALTSAAAPLLLISAISALPLAVALHRSDRQLAKLQEEYGELLARDRAEDHARFRCACERLQDLRDEYRNGLGFTDEMKVRLALVEQEVNILLHKYLALTRARKVEESASARLYHEERRLLVLASFAAIQVDHHRLLLALQDNWSDVERSRRESEKRVEEYAAALRSLVESDPTREYRQELQDKADSMRRWTKLLPWSPKLKAEKALDELRELERGSESTAKSITSPEAPDSQHSMVIWKEKTGGGHDGPVRAFYTSDLKLEITENPRAA